MGRGDGLAIYKENPEFSHRGKYKVRENKGRGKPKIKVNGEVGKALREKVARSVSLTQSTLYLRWSPS